jgi:hypothetical protein
VARICTFKHVKEPIYRLGLWGFPTCSPPGPKYPSSYIYISQVFALNCIEHFFSPKVLERVEI